METKRASSGMTRQDLHDYLRRILPDHNEHAIGKLTQELMTATPDLLQQLECDLQRAERESRAKHWQTAFGFALTSATIRSDVHSTSTVNVVSASDLLGADARTVGTGNRHERRAAKAKLRRKRR